jgi:hypothetical protein
MIEHWRPHTHPHAKAPPEENTPAAAAVDGVFVCSGAIPWLPHRLTCAVAGSTQRQGIHVRLQRSARSALGWALSNEESIQWLFLATALYAEDHSSAPGSPCRAFDHERRRWALRYLHACMCTKMREYWRVHRRDQAIHISGSQHANKVTSRLARCGMKGRKRRASPA